MTAKIRTYRTRMPATPEALYDWHDRPGAFRRLSPPWQDVRVERVIGTIWPGDRKLLRIPLFGLLGVCWELVHSDDVEGLGFVDTQVRGPFRSWCHEHRFLPAGSGHAYLGDRLHYSLPLGPLGCAVAGKRITHELDRLFELRHARTRLDLERLGKYERNDPMRIAITGSTGLVGERLVSFLRGGGHEALRLVRSTPSSRDGVYWNPASGEIDADALEGLDAVIHLAGVSINSGLWTKKRKQAILESRVQGTELLARTLAGLHEPPQVLVTASGVNYYGDSGDRKSTEASPKGEGFLADVVERWEGSADPAREAGIRVVHARFGVVLAGEGGMLPLISMPFRFGVGGPIGSGKQWMSWIALDDLMNILHEAIVNEELVGPINATSPEPVTNEKFSKTLARVLDRPSFMRVPRFAASTIGGQLADELILISQRVIPARLDEIGFRFGFPSLEAALRHELGRYDGGRSRLRQQRRIGRHGRR